MRRAAATLAAWLALLSLPAPAHAQRPDGPSALPLLEVPYVSQGELLCGGAAAAMLMRASGARRVYAEDFQPLVDRKAGGIHTQALADALRARGYAVQVVHGDTRLAQGTLAGGRPVLALIQDRPGRFHYVVIVGWAQGRVVYHDPARAPFLSRTEADFDRSWAPTDRWMLVIDPRTSQFASPSAGAEAEEATPDDAATERFLARDYEQAAKLARQAVEHNPDDRVSWRLLAASLYLSGDSGRALDAWNHAGDPKLDLVHIEGLARTPHRAVERLIGLQPGTTLTRSDLVRADRRLGLLPAGQSSRVSYEALPENLAEVRGVVVERPPYPSRLEWLAAGMRLGINRELSLTLANVATAGDTLTARWRFWEGRPATGLTFAFPAARTGGVVSMSLDWQREAYALVARTERRQALVNWSNWASARLRFSAGAGVGEWVGTGRSALLRVEAEFRPVSDRLAVEVTAFTASAGEAFATTTSVVRWRQAIGQVTVLGDHALAYASSSAPPDLWPGAGSGIARPFLLRAHTLVADGRIEGPAFGRTLIQSSIEAQRNVARRGFATWAVATFVDMARAWDRPDGSVSPLHVDVGAGLRLRLAPGQPTIRIDFAHGLRDGRNAVSLAWQPGWPHASVP